MLAKIHIPPTDTGRMCHAEAAAWIDSVLTSMGIKQEKEIISLRRIKPNNRTANSAAIHNEEKEV